MGENVKNGVRVLVYHLFCPACSQHLTLRNLGRISGKTDRHLTIDDCPCCKARLSIDYDKARNEVVATVKELKDEQ